MDTKPRLHYHDRKNPKVDTDWTGSGTFTLRFNGTRENPSWVIDGPAHVAQTFFYESVAIAVCATLNALYNDAPFPEL